MALRRADALMLVSRATVWGDGSGAAPAGVARRSLTNSPGGGAG
jgi:hypothetical protein